jgi:hypothetical protein
MGNSMSCIIHHLLSIIRTTRTIRIILCITMVIIMYITMDTNTILYIIKVITMDIITDTIKVSAQAKAISRILNYFVDSDWLFQNADNALVGIFFMSRTA